MAIRYFTIHVKPLFVLLGSFCLSEGWSPVVDRRQIVQSLLLPVAGSSISPILSDSFVITTDSVKAPNEATFEHPFRYSADWIGTNLPILSLEDSVDQLCWTMARWPDPSLRTAAAAVSEDHFGSSTLKSACDRLRDTAVTNGAVGLAAQQCGVNARMIYLKDQAHVLVNPVVLQRSPEELMRVWRETCLVFPPTFRATVLRDSWVMVQFHDWKGRRSHSLFRGETARAFQHEMDHDRGILITDHIEEMEMENDLMRSIERNGHEDRMDYAFERYVTSNP